MRKGYGNVTLKPDPPQTTASPNCLDSTTRFSIRAEDYIKFRPTYPAAAIDAILQGLGDPATLLIADVGAGTGISSRVQSHYDRAEPGHAGIRRGT